MQFRARRRAISVSGCWPARPCCRWRVAASTCRCSRITVRWARATSLPTSGGAADHRGTVARGELDADTYFQTGKIGSTAGDYMPFPVTAEVLARGQQRYNIYCSPCHSEVGDGNGMIVQRGYQQPPSYHIERLRKAPIGHFFDVITQRLRQDARLCRAGAAAGPLGDCGLHPCAATEPGRHQGGRAGGRTDCPAAARREFRSCRHTTPRARPTRLPQCHSECSGCFRGRARSHNEPRKLAG